MIDDTSSPDFLGGYAVGRIEGFNHGLLVGLAVGIAGLISLVVAMVLT